MLVFDSIVVNNGFLGSNRKIDSNGYLRVKTCNITKEQVAPYLGREIPNSESFGLEPEKVYYVYRPQKELEKAVESFNNLPLTREHIEVDVDNVPKDKIVGSLGDSAEYKSPYIKNSLIVYDQKDIDWIMSGKKKELSCGYRYTPVRESGEFNGQHYDFVMTDIVGNHVALVREGRAGHDVMVSDEKPNFAIDAENGIIEEKENDMFFKKNELVEDAKQSEAEKEKIGVVMKEFKEGTLKSGSGEKVTDPAQAKAIALSEAEKVKDEIPEKQDKPETAGEVKAEKEDSKMEDKKKESLAEDKCAKDEDIDKRKLIDEIGGILKGKVDDELICTIIGKAEKLAYEGSEAGEADDAEIKTKEQKEDFAEGVKYGEEKEKEEPKKLDSEHESEGMKKEEEKKAEDKCDKKMAKDEMTFDINAIKEQVRAEVIEDFKAREEARKAVKSVIGDVNVMAFDSCDEIYKLACEKAGMDVNGIVSPKDAFRGFMAAKGKLTLDATPKSSGNVEECLKDIRI